MASLQDVFLAHLQDYARARTLAPREARAARAIAGCYSSAMGSHLIACPRGHEVREQFHACRHRSCPRCAAGPRRLWIDAELQRLLPCEHFHVVFTLPHELLGLWASNREVLIALFMRCVRECLLQMMADPRHLGATPGILMCLHTWGRNLSYHPHVHALVSAGGLRPDGRWQPTRSGFLLPLAPLRKLFAGKLLAHLRSLLLANQLAVPAQQPAAHWHTLIRTLYRKHWNLQINAPYASGRSVTLYLARYAKGGPLPHERALTLQAGHVSFDYTDHRDQRRKRLRLPAAEFIARVLWHAPPKGVHTTRHAGLYASTARLQHTHALLAVATSPSGTPPAAAPLCAHEPQDPSPSCRVCGAAMHRVTAAMHPAHDQISLLFSHLRRHPTPTAAHLGPTQRWNGQPTAKAPRPPPPPYHLAAAGGGL